MLSEGMQSVTKAFGHKKDPDKKIVQDGDELGV